MTSRIRSRGGDALYGALRRSVDEASDNLEELGERVRRMVGAEDEDSEEAQRDRAGFGGWIGHGPGDFEKLVQNAVERVFRMLDLPRRRDIDELNRNLERVASAVETLEKAFERKPDAGTNDDHPPTTPNA